MSISIKINDREIGPDFPPLVLAEVGINHEGDFDKAICLVDAASKVGAEVVKFQTHITDKEMLKTDMTPGDISNESSSARLSPTLSASTITRSSLPA